MTTKNPRLNVTLDAPHWVLLTTLAQRKQQSLSNVAKDLIEASLERDEDVYFSRLADRRDTAATVWVADEKAWQ
ncbi:MAG: hypothetical protein ACK48E_03790 [Holosporales bacterium]|jgi:hypothetical protein